MVNVSQKYEFYFTKTFQKGEGRRGLLKASPGAKLSWKIHRKRGAVNVKQEGVMQILRRTNENADLVYFIAAFISASLC